MGRINSYTTIGNRLADDDYLAVDGATNGTRKIDKRTLLYSLSDSRMWGQQNEFAFKTTLLGNNNLGSSITGSQLSKIRERDFSGFNLGDYWVINGHNYTIIDFNYFLGFEDTTTKPHIVVLSMSGGIADSAVALNGNNSEYTLLPNGLITQSITDLKQQFTSQLNTDIGDSVLSIWTCLPNTNILDSTDKLPSVVCKEKALLLNEYMVYGSGMFGLSWDGKFTRQFSWFRERTNSSIYVRNIWLGGDIAKGGKAIMDYNGDGNPKMVGAQEMHFIKCVAAIG